MKYYIKHTAAGSRGTLHQVIDQDDNVISERTSKSRHYTGAKLVKRNCRAGARSYTDAPYVLSWHQSEAQLIKPFESWRAEERTGALALVALARGPEWVDYSSTPLASVGSTLSENGVIFPLNQDGTADTSSGVALGDCSDEWWARIDVKDRAACIDWAKNAGERGHGTIPGPLLDFVAKERPAAMKETPEPTGPWATQDDYI